MRGDDATEPVDLGQSFQITAAAFSRLFFCDARFTIRVDDEQMPTKVSGVINTRCRPARTGAGAATPGGDKNVAIVNQQLCAIGLGGLV